MKKFFWGCISFIILAVLLGYFIPKSGSYDDFAQCLTDKEIKMYGAYWCSHCQAQKALFGSSWDKVTYIECATPGSNDPKTECIIAGIETYPTWEFADGNKISTELSLKQLSSFSGCDLPAK